MRQWEERYTQHLYSIKVGDMEIDECGNLFFPTLILFFVCLICDCRVCFPQVDKQQQHWRPEQQHLISRRCRRCHPIGSSSSRLVPAPMRHWKCFIDGSFSLGLIKKKVSNDTFLGRCRVFGLDHQPPASYNNKSVVTFGIHEKSARSLDEWKKSHTFLIW